MAGPDRLDVDRFTQLCAASQKNGVAPQENGAASHENGAAGEALAIYRGDFLEGDFDDWASAQRERLAAQYEALLSRAAAAAKDVAASQILLGWNPYDESAYAQFTKPFLEYPQSLKWADIEGIASVGVSLSAAGRPTHAWLIKSTGTPLLDRAALKTALASSYIAEQVQCSPVGDYKIVVHFSPDQE